MSGKLAFAVCYEVAPGTTALGSQTVDDHDGGDIALVPPSSVGDERCRAAH